MYSGHPLKAAGNAPSPRVTVPTYSSSAPLIVGMPSVTTGGHTLAHTPRQVALPCASGENVYTARPAASRNARRYFGKPTLSTTRARTSGGAGAALVGDGSPTSGEPPLEQPTATVAAAVAASSGRHTSPGIRTRSTTAFPADKSVSVRCPTRGR